MKGIFDFIVKTKDGRYNNEKNIGDSKLILNTELENYNFVSRIGIVVGVPKDNDTGVFLYEPREEVMDKLDDLLSNT